MELATCPLISVNDFIIFSREKRLYIEINRPGARARVPLSLSLYIFLTGDASRWQHLPMEEEPRRQLCFSIHSSTQESGCQQGGGGGSRGGRYVSEYPELSFSTQLTIHKEHFEAGSLHRQFPYSYNRNGYFILSCGRNTLV